MKFEFKLKIVFDFLLLKGRERSVAKVVVRLQGWKIDEDVSIEDERERKGAMLWFNQWR